MPSAPSRNPSPLRVFLCHASGDKPAVRKLYQRLRRAGFRPWLDEKDILPGQDWESEIQNALRSADVVIVCLSNHAVSKYGYVQKEIRLALDTADRKPERTIFIIPLKLDECTVPESLGRWHWLNYTSPDGYDSLLRALRLTAAALDGRPAATTSSVEPVRPPRRTAKAKNEDPAHGPNPQPMLGGGKHPAREKETRLNASTASRFVALFEVLKDCYVSVGGCNPSPKMEAARRELIGWSLCDDEFAQLSSLVGSGDERACGAADEILSVGKICITSSTVAVTYEMLSSPISPVQQVAIRALMRMERQDPRIITDKVLARLASLLREVGLGWLTVAYFVECLGPRACTAKMLEALEVCLYTSNVSVRAPDIVLALGPAAATAKILSRLMYLIKEGSADASHSAANALFVFRDSLTSSAIFADVFPLLKHKRWYRRAAAAIAIGSLGPRFARDAAESLAELLFDEEYDVQAAAVEGIGKLGAVCAELQPEIIVKILGFALDPNDQGYLKRIAVRTLGELGPSAAIPEVLAGLKALRHDSDQEISDDADDSFLALRAKTG